MCKAMTALEFARGFSDATGQTVVVIRTEGTGASSMRYLDIAGIDDGTRDMLLEDGLAFLRFDQRKDAVALVATIAAHYPPPDRMTLDIEATATCRGHRDASFSQVSCGARDLVLA